MVGSTLEREELLQSLFAELNRFVRCDSLALYWRLPNGNFLLTAVLSGESAVALEQVGSSSGNDIPEEKAQPFYCPDNCAGSHPVLRWLGGRGLSTSLCVPVVVAQQLLGWLAASRRESGSFSLRELHPLVQVAQLVGPAVNSFRLYERLEAAHKDLAAARDELVRSERLVVQGELASGVAHDINNILGLISARSDLLKLQGVSPQAEASVDAIRQAVDDGITVVRRMTQYTRRQRNQELVGLDVNRLVEDVLEMTRPRWQPAPSKGRAIRVRFRSGPTSTVMGVPSELREVMVNLIMNSVDAIPSGGDIVIETGQKDGWAIVSVADTGCGITEEVRQHIFDPFFTTKGESGSGLGLWVSNGIVARHGGDIQVQSDLGKGSTFQVRLPLAKAAAPVAQPAQKAAGLRRSILVVDDEIGLGEAIKLSLEMVGYQVTFSPNPLEALGLFKDGAFDLVITDLRMPGMTGWEMAAKMKRVCPKTPIIAMTGWPVDLIRDGQKCSDMEAIIQKPYRVNELRAKVAKLLEAGRREG
ncbi:MAG: hybrid sensor histidine kinase/response regulator [Chloroflexota bacterium]